MDIKKSDPRKVIFWVILTILFIPWVQDSFQFIKVRELSGSIEKKFNPILNEKSWLDGHFQNAKASYLNSKFGFQPSFVRLNNQIDFSLFDKVNANSVIRGKENYLFEINYLRAYFGQDFIGEDSIRTRMLNLKKIQDSLASKNKLVLLVFAASKGQFYPEYFPDSSNVVRTTTNYERHLKLANELGINFIDFNAYFLQNKNTAPYPLYTKYGIHWSYYGACLVADSLIHYIESARNIDLPELSWNQIDKEQARFEDNDIEKGLNLIFPLKGPSLAYPQIAFENFATKNKSNIMVIADSYYWTIYKMGLPNAFGNSSFWYYYREIYSPDKQKSMLANQVLLKQALRNQDVFIIISTDANLTNLGWGFIEWTSRLVDNNEYQNLDFEERVANLIKYIPSDSAWIQKIRIKALEKGISIDSMVVLDAMWLIEHESKK
ncbi:MAG: hypothetical protein IPL42_11920 [Saprospiraceae bacterium]|nr:hypothetical protein [Saprospiraceae bacterium]